MCRGFDRDLAGMLSDRRQERTRFELPIGRRNCPAEYHDSFAGLESQVHGKGKEKAVDLLQNHGMKALLFEENAEMDAFYEYPSDEEEDDETFPSEFYDPIGEEHADKPGSFLLAEYFLKSFFQPFAKPSFEHPKFVAGPSRITLDDLRRDSLFQSRRWP
ncbi:hypothetical protein GALMADRAFT_248611 [Galerina marginata CBS 339.88]|uniref:Uncharacterized protein n=1 Tax=Galerina marginata (strain CBS 339.88) TaxID=685588 RepID=A0A067T7I2_GALM3|nr:hypothetical protein GALMADRAFT_248611 [Galerina marginata CBS 339.88]